MSCPQPTAQYGQTLSVTVAPRSREVFAAVCLLNGSLDGCACAKMGRLNIAITSVLGSESGVRRKGQGKSVIAFGLLRPGPWYRLADALGAGVNVEAILSDEA